MFSCCLGSCFASESGVQGGPQKSFPKNGEVLRRTRIAFKPDAPLQQLLTPLDLFPFVFRQYFPWAVFFNHGIDFQRLVDALHTVAQKYLLLCGRLCTDDRGRYVIEVGLTEGKQYDFPASEMKADMQMAEAVLRHGQTTANSADFPVHPDQLPFYLEPLNLVAIHKGQEPLLTVKLTHFSDGCCLAISICHFLVDGMRFSELYRDIGRAYCGKEVPMRDINRQYMTFEGFSQHFSPKVKEDCMIPKTIPTGREPLNPKQYSNESASLEILHLSKELIDNMKSRAAQFIPKGSFVSTADLMQALLWMLDCELCVDFNEVRNSTDLDIEGTSSIYVAELYCNGLGVIPKNYLGNGTVAPCFTAGKDLESKTLFELLAALALLTRQKQVEIKEQPQQVFKLLGEKYSPFNSAPENACYVVSNFCKFVISDTDFEDGPPALFLCHSGLPLTGGVWFVSPVFRDGGVLLTQTVTTKQKQRIKKSSVLKECAPGLRFLFDDFCTTELNDLMKQK